MYTNTHVMPTLFYLFGLRFFFFSREHLPIHVHVEGHGGTAKFEIDPIRLIESKGLKQNDLKLAESIIEENAEIIRDRWIEFLGQ